jgi:hypothetical protein
LANNLGACSCLSKATKLGDEFKKAAIDDPDLDELWKWVH